MISFSLIYFLFNINLCSNIQLPIESLDDYEEITTNIESDYLLTNYQLYNNSFYANNSHYSISNNGIIYFENEFKKLDDYSSFIYDSENNITYYACTDDYLVLSSNNNSYNYTYHNLAVKPSQKCSITLLNDSDINYPIVSGIKKSKFLNFSCAIYYAYFIKLDSTLSLKRYFYSKIGTSCSLSVEAEISTCISIYNQNYILCVFRYSYILVGGVINSYFNDFAQLYYIHGEYNDFFDFFFFAYNDTGILISRKNNTNIFYVTQIKVNTDTYYLKRNNITKFESELDLNNIGIAFNNDGFFIGTILNEYIYLYNLNLIEFTQYVVKIENSDSIRKISLIYFERDYLGLIFLNQTDTDEYNVTYSIFSYPEKLNCTPENFTSYSYESINIDITGIFPNYTNAFLSQNPFNLEIIDKNVSGNTLSYGTYKTKIVYLYTNNYQNIFISDSSCYFTYQICNEACENCDIFSNDSENTLCNKCITNYAPLVNLTSQCEKNTKNLSLYYYNSTDDMFNLCFTSCLYCSEEGNELENNCDICLNDNYRLSYMKTGQCILCDNSNNLFYYSSNEGTICLDISITDCPEEYPYIINDNNECTSSCPSSYPILLNNQCLNECPSEEGFVYSYYYNTCVCSSSYLYYYDVDNNNNLVCILDSKTCPNNYPIKSYRECKKKEEGKDIIFNGETIDECPENSEQIDIGDYYSCSCITPYYILDNIIYCSSNEFCTRNSNGYIYLIKELNLCVTECNEEYPINFNYTCLKECPSGYVTYNNKCVILTGLEITGEVTVEVFDLYTVTTTQNFIAQTYDTSEESTNNANSYYGNLSTIDFGECINILKEENNIPESENLIIIKIDIIREDSITNQVEYSILTKDGVKLDLSVCSNVSIEIENTVHLSSEELNLEKALEALAYGYDIYNVNDIFYNDICTIFSNSDGSDVLLEDRKSDYYTNISFCEDNCVYGGINLTTLRVTCLCEIKTEVSDEETGFSFQSLTSSFSSVITNSNIRVFICYKKVFSKYLYKNIGFWIMLILLIGESFCFILYCLTGFDPLILKIQKAKEFYELDKVLEKDSQLEEYITNKNLFPSATLNAKNNSYNNSTSRINPANNPPKKKQSNNVTFLCDVNNSEKELNISEKKFNILSPIEKKLRKGKTLKHYLEEKFNGNKENNINKNITPVGNIEIQNPKLKLITQYKKKKHKKKYIYEKYKPGSELNGNKIKLYSGKLKIMKTNNFDDSDKSSSNSEKTNKEKEKLEKNKNTKTDEQLNSLSYNDAINNDKRTFIKIYYGFIKYSQLLIFTFITDSDYNLKYIKIILCTFSFIGYFFFNTLFFTDKTMSNIYENKGKYQFLYSLPKTIFSSLCCILINMLLKCISLSNTQISTLAKEKDAKKEEKLLLEIMRNLKIKLIIFFILVFLFSSIFWYYITAFCAVYINTQKHLITNTLLSFAESMIYPFGICLITACLRFFSLKYKIKIMFFISKIFQLI